MGDEKLRAAVSEKLTQEEAIAVLAVLEELEVLRVTSRRLTAQRGEMVEALNGAVRDRARLFTEITGWKALLKDILFLARSAAPFVPIMNQASYLQAVEEATKVLEKDP